MKLYPLSLILISVAVAVGYLLLGSSLTVYLTLSIFYLIGVRIVTAQETSQNVSIFIVLAALVFRVIAFMQPPTFSDDVFRYRFEGQVQAEGINPYVIRPADPQSSRFRDEAWGHVVAKDFRAGYGPLIERMEAWNWRLAAAVTEDPFRQAHLFKVPAALFDLGCIVLLWKLAPKRILLYAWCPVVVVEFWGSGHNDAVPVFFILAALLAAKRNLQWLVFLLVGFGIAAKWWPAVLMLAFTGREIRRVMYWPLAAIPVVFFGFPYWANVMENAQFMTGFVGGWRNNDSLFGLIAKLFTNPYHAKYAVFGLIGGAAVAIAVLRNRTLEWRVLATLTTLLLLSANCHVWYLTWLAALLPLSSSYGVQAWVSLVPIFHLSRIEEMLTGQWHGVLEERWYVYLPVFLLFGVDLLTSLDKQSGLDIE